jgi:hypothetical protein
MCGTLLIFARASADKYLSLFFRHGRIQVSANFRLEELMDSLNWVIVDAADLGEF